MFSNKKILIIGESALDIYNYCDSSKLRFAPECPSPLITVKNQVKSAGLAGNVARNVEAFKVPYNLITNDGWENISKSRYIDERSNYMFVRIDSYDKIDRIKNLDKIEWNKYEAVLIPDYFKGYLHNDDIKYISESHPLTFLDTKRKLGPFAYKISFIKINEIEYENTKDTIDDILKDKIIVTLGDKGCRYKGINYPVEDGIVVDRSGLGDSWHVSFALKYIRTKNIESALIFGNKCATICAGKKGVSTIEKDDWGKLKEDWDFGLDKV